MQTPFRATGPLTFFLRGALAACIVLGAFASASAETLMMPKRDARKSVPVVVWGVTTQSSPVSACTIDFGDGSPAGVCDGAERSYLGFAHAYASPGIYTATLTVGLESATTQVTVFDPATFPGGGAASDNNRSLGINMAIEDGLRYLWLSQSNRAGNFPSGTTTNWGNNWPSADAALITLAFQNHGYKLANNGSAPTGLYEKYIVRRGLNYVISALSNVGLSSQASGIAGQPVRDPCVGAGIEASPCTGLRNSTDFTHESYLTAVSILPLAASGALARTNTEVGGITNGKTYKEILQRLVNALAWGQIDSNTPSRGGWFYRFNDGTSDGSTVGWAILAMLDSEAAGTVVPAWVKTEFAYALTGGLNDNGGFDYQANGVAGPQNGITGNYYAATMEKGGIPLQGMFLIGETSGSRVDLVKSYINKRWNSGRLEDDYNQWTGCQVAGQYNKGCAYSMFNAFKGLKLQGITTLPNVTRPAGPGSQPAGDWYADYQDWLVTNQTSPNTLGGGYWGTMQFSCCYSGTSINAAIAELILSPVALVLPDGDKFADVGLSPATATATEGGTHTVTAHAESTGGTPVAAATVTFTVLTGPNAGTTGSGVTNAAGDATFTYTDAGPDGTIGTDTIRASIGSLNSNTVEMIWTPKNQPPVATDNAYTIDEDTVLAGNVQTDGVADSDPDGDTMTTSLVSGVSDGTLVLNADGSFTYTPNANFFGTDSFTYKVSDGIVDSNVATVTITVASVNDPPVADPDVKITPEDTPVSGQLASSDIDGGAPTYALATPPAHGSVVVNADGSYTYTPAPDYNGGDSFTFSVDDGNGGTATNTVTITVTPVNDAPVCTAAEASPKILWPPNHSWAPITILGVTDVEGDPVTIIVTGIFQDEPTDSQGDGRTAIDGRGIGTSTAWVRAERIGNAEWSHEKDDHNKVRGDGRVYHIRFTATDPSGASCTGEVTVGVPHDMGAHSTPVDGGPLYDSTKPTPPPGHGPGDGCEDNDHEKGRKGSDSDKDRDRADDKGKGKDDDKGKGKKS